MTTSQGYVITKEVNKGNKEDVGEKILIWNNNERDKNLVPFPIPVWKNQVWAALSLSHFTANNNFKCPLSELCPCVPTSL